VPCMSVTAAAVTLDLGGFVLTGKGGTSGILASAGPVTITNGVISSFKNGILATATGVIGVTLSYLSVRNNQGTGAVLGEGAQVSDSSFVGNGTGGSGDGLQVWSGAIVTQCAFIGNKGDGLHVEGPATVITRNRAAGNTANGLLTHGDSVLRNNTAIGNTSLGFSDSGGASAFRSNVASGNGNAGFLAFNSTLIGNNASSNKGAGFDDEGENTFEGNTAFSNGTDGFDGGSPFTTFYNNTTSSNSRDGLDLLCPDNLINATAEGNKVGNLNLLGTCQLINVLH
jgi:parallel beta-helix repeat protein